MIIRTKDNKFILTCDICLKQVEVMFDTFNDAVRYKRDNRWASQRHIGHWEDVCFYCRFNGRMV